MRKLIFLLMLLMISPMFVYLLAQEMPLVYDVENTGADCPKPPLLLFGQLSSIQALPDPFAWSDGRGRISSYCDWRCRRAEIKAEIEHYEIGEKPDRPDSITASYSGGILTVNITVNGNTLTLTSAVTLPSGSGPFPAVIGIGSSKGSLPSNIFTSRNIARITFNFGQVMAHQQIRGSEPINKLYPDLIYIGAYCAWSWGISRLIDGLELVQANLPIDLRHLAITGCSFAGKMALFAGAFDERIALTISQESGGGGYTTWRFSETQAPGSVENLSRTDRHWFIEDLFQFSNAVPKLPFDHHELMGMVAPRALLVTGNPSQIWLSDESGYVGSKAAQQIYSALGVPERFSFSIIGDHPHCAVPSSQIPEIEAFVDKFLLGKDSVNTNISTSPYNTNLSPWINWTAPILSNDKSYFTQASLVYPSNLQEGLEKNITFKWNKVEDAEKYLLQLSLSPTFTNIAISDSTTDTTKTFDNLLEGKRYYWRVQVKNVVGASGPWSEVRSFTTFIPLPTIPLLVSVAPYPNRPGWFTFKWHKVKNVDQYFIQASEDQTFTTIFFSDSTITDTTKILWTFSEGKKYYWRVQAKNIGGSGPWSDVWNFISSATDVKEEEGIPTECSISQNYPNPFNPTTKIKFALPQTALTKIIVYDLLGREIQTQINKELEAGYHEINFEASNLTNGVYFYKIQIGNFIQTKKMVLMK